MNKPDLGSIKPTCGQCDHWRLLEGDDGEFLRTRCDVSMLSV